MASALHGLSRRLLPVTLPEDRLVRGVPRLRQSRGPVRNLATEQRYPWLSGRGQEVRWLQSPGVATLGNGTWGKMNSGRYGRAQMTDTADSAATPLGRSLTAGQGYDKWRRLVALPPSNHHGGTYRVYVIEVEPLAPDCRWHFYVGHTAGTVEKRFDQHAQGGPLAARIFSLTGSPPRPRARAERLREDLMLGTPVFNSKEAAMQAEGLLARMLEARGHPTKSDVKKRSALRKQLRQRHREDQLNRAKARRGEG